jgi:hypothetical protein
MPLIDPTCGSAFSRSLMLCATAVFWNHARIVASFAGFAVVLGAYRTSVEAMRGEAMQWYVLNSPWLVVETRQGFRLVSERFVSAMTSVDRCRSRFATGRACLVMAAKPALVEKSSRDVGHTRVSSKRAGSR